MCWCSRRSRRQRRRSNSNPRPYLRTIFGREKQSFNLDLARVELISNSAARNEVQTTASEVQFKTAEARRKNVEAPHQDVRDRQRRAAERDERIRVCQRARRRYASVEHDRPNFGL